MILKLIGVLMLFAVGLLVPRRLLQDEHGQLDLGGFGWCYTVGLAWVLYLTFFQVAPRLTVHNDSDINPVIVRVGQLEVRVPRGQTASLDLPDESFWNERKAEALTVEGDVIETVVLPESVTGWTYRVLDRANSIGVLAPASYAGRESE